MIRHCLTEKEVRYKKNIIVFSNIYNILQHFTAFYNYGVKNYKK